MMHLTISRVSSVQRSLLYVKDNNYVSRAFFSIIERREINGFNRSHAPACRWIPDFTPYQRSRAKDSCDGCLMMNFTKTCAVSERIGENGIKGDDDSVGELLFT